MNSQHYDNRNANFLNPLFDKEKREALLRKQEYERNLQLKAEILEKEFEKQLLQENLEEISTQENHLKLRGVFDSIYDMNQNKIKELNRIDEQIEQIEEQEKSLSRVPSFRLGSSKDLRLGPSVISADPWNIHEAKERQAQMKEREQLVNELQVKEEQAQMTLEHKFDLMCKDNMILKERVYELLRSLGHAADRFKDLIPAEFTAKNLEALTMLELKEIHKKVQELQEKEDSLRKTVQDYHRDVTEKLNDSKTRMSDVLVKIDQYRRLKEQQEKRIEELENYHIHLQEHKTNSQQLVRTIEVLEQLEKDYVLSKRNSRPEHDDQSEEGCNDQSESSRNSNCENTTAADISGDTSAAEIQALMQTLDKNHFLYKIYEFSLKRSKGGVQQLADRLIEIFQNMTQKERSLKSQYEELSRQKGKKSSELSELKAKLQRMKAQNKDETLDNELNALVSQSHMNNTLSTGFIPVGDTVSTLNQVLAGGVHQVDVSVLLDKTEEKQTAAISLYAGIIGMLLKFTSLVSKIEAHNYYSISDELKTIAKDIQNYIKSIRDAKRPTSSNSITDIQLEKSSENRATSRPQSVNDLDTDIDKINPERVVSLFLKNFEGFQEHAVNFSAFLQNDQFIKNFVSPQTINEYLCKHSSSCISKEEAVDGALEDTTDLVRDGSKILLERIEALTDKYIEFIQEISYNFQGYQEELESRRQAAGVKEDIEAKKKLKRVIMPEKLNNLQEAVVLKHCKLNDISHPKRNLLEEESQLAAQENFELKKEEDNEELNDLDDEKIRGKLTGIAHNFLEKKRGNFYRINKIQYPYQTKRQLEQESQKQQYIRKKKMEETLTLDQREDNYLQSERAAIKQKQSEDMLKLQTDKDQTDGKDNITPGYATERPRDMLTAQAKKKMIENSQFINKIHFIETQINSDKYNKFRRSNYGNNLFASLEKLKTVATIPTQKQIQTPKKKAKSTTQLEDSDHPLDFRQTRIKQSGTPTPRKSTILPKVQNYRPVTSTATLTAKRQYNEQAKSTEPSFAERSAFLQETYGGKKASRKSEETASRTVDSIFHDTEVIIEKILAKGNKKPKKPRLSRKNGESTGYNSTDSTFSTKTRMLFKDYDSIYDNVCGSMVLSTPFGSRSERTSYNYEPFKSTTPSILVENPRF